MLNTRRAGYAARKKPLHVLYDYKLIKPILTRCKAGLKDKGEPLSSPQQIQARLTPLRRLTREG